MAIVTVSYDTKEKTMSLAVDGTPQSNVVGCEFGLDYEGKDYACMFVQRERDDEHDITKYTRTMAADLGEAKASVNSLANEVRQWRKRA